MTLHVTRPSLPPLEDYTELLRSVWDSGILTNNGPLVQRFEKELAEYLGVPGVVVFCNGTIALMAALSIPQTRDCGVITSPFTFPATVKAIKAVGANPCFVDIDLDTWTLDMFKSEFDSHSFIRAIVPVNAFGVLCRGVAPGGIPVIYDSAHAFGSTCNGKSVASFGNLSVLSFHATKLFTTGEGGAVVYHKPDDARRLKDYRNFAIQDETRVGFGRALNGKMSELHAALGILNLRTVDREIAKRRSRAGMYVGMLYDVPGVRFQDAPAEVNPNASYFPILIDPAEFGATRDDVAAALAAEDIIARKYFYPLASEGYRPASDFPVADYVSRNILCLPLYGSLPESEVERVCSIVESKARS